MLRRGFVFDLDGVIADTADYHFRAWKCLAAGLGIEIDRQFNERLKGVSREDSLQLVLAHGGLTGKIDSGRLKELMDQKNCIYQGFLKGIKPSDTLPGVRSFLEGAAQTGVPCVVASASHSAPLVVRMLGLTGLISAIVDPASLVRGKPDPEIFVQAAALVGMPPGAMVGFEDSQAGINGMRACGMRAVACESEGRLTGADETIGTFVGLDVACLLDR